MKETPINTHLCQRLFHIQLLAQPFPCVATQKNKKQHFSTQKTISYRQGKVPFCMLVVLQIALPDIFQSLLNWHL